MTIRGFKFIKGSGARPILWGMTLVLMLQLLWACNYGRMNEDEAVHTYQTIMPEMPKRAIPIDGGIQILRESNPEELLNPIVYNEESVGRGKTAYGYYCVQCHGPLADGRGTVGQSFAPLPADFRDLNVQDQSDGSLFYRISLGFNRHPPLWHTVAQDDRWALVNYIRSLATPKES